MNNHEVYYRGHIGVNSMRLDDIVFIFNFSFLPLSLYFVMANHEILSHY